MVGVLMIVLLSQRCCRARQCTKGGLTVQPTDVAWLLIGMNGLQADNRPAEGFQGGIRELGHWHP